MYGISWSSVSASEDDVTIFHTRQLDFDISGGVLVPVEARRSHRFYMVSRSSPLLVTELRTRGRPFQQLFACDQSFVAVRWLWLCRLSLLYKARS
jgi:hypothetical protein